jgi:translation initiation factor IF-3
LEDTIIKELQINDQIRDREVRVIDEKGEMLGIMSADEANAMADERNLDLVKISPQAVPPVCKFLDYGKYRFELIKKEKEARKNQKVVELKEIWLSATIDDHDLDVKAKQSIKFLLSGDRVRASIRLKGRQMAHPEIAMEIMNSFAEKIGSNGIVEKKAQQEGRTIAMIFSPAKK